MYNVTHINEGIAFLGINQRYPNESPEEGEWEKMTGSMRKAVVAVVVRSNGISFYSVPASERWPPDKQDLLIIVPSQSVVIENLQDFFSDATAAEIYHVFQLNRRYLLQLVSNNTINDNGEPDPSEKGVRPQHAGLLEGKPSDMDNSD